MAEIAKARRDDGLMLIDIPMACVAMRRHVLDACRYEPHECGEDLGFGLSLADHGFRCVWDTSLHARHVMDERELAVV